MYTTPSACVRNIIKMYVAKITIFLFEYPSPVVRTVLFNIILNKYWPRVCQSSVTYNRVIPKLVFPLLYGHFHHRFINK